MVASVRVRLDAVPHVYGDGVVEARADVYLGLVGDVRVINVAPPQDVRRDAVGRVRWPVSVGEGPVVAALVAQEILVRGDEVAVPREEGPHEVSPIGLAGARSLDV